MPFKIIGSVSHVETIASGNGIRERRRLRMLYGPGRWRKLKGTAAIELADDLEGARLLSKTTTFGFDARLPIRACDDASEQQVPPLRSLRFASVGMTIQLGSSKSSRSKIPRSLDFTRDDNGWGGLNLRDQNPRVRFGRITPTYLNRSRRKYGPRNDERRERLNGRWERPGCVQRFPRTRKTIKRITRTVPAKP